MIGHLGSRVSALLDGQLDPAEEERAWTHVHTCHQCRDAVEREGWVKTRLAGLSGLSARDADEVSARLRGTLRDPLSHADLGAWSAHDPTGPTGLTGQMWSTTARHRAGLAVLGGGALSAAFVGVLALGVAPADPQLPLDRRAPLTDLSSVRDSPSPTPSPTTPPATSPATSPAGPTPSPTSSPGTPSPGTQLRSR